MPARTCPRASGEGCLAAPSSAGDLPGARPLRVCSGDAGRSYAPKSCSPPGSDAPAQAALDAALDAAVQAALDAAFAVPD